MFNFIINIINYRVVFIIELLLAMAISTVQLKRRENFAKKVFGAAMLLLVICRFLPIVAYNTISLMFIFLFLFFIMLVFAYFCFDEPVYNILFCGVTAYTTQHIAFETYNFILTVTGMANYGDVYQENSLPNINIITILVYFLSYCMIYWMIWVLMSYLLYDEEDFDIGAGYTKLFLTFIIVLVDVVLNAVLVYGVGDKKLPVPVYVVMYLQSILCCALALAVHFALLWREQEKKEVVRVKELWNADKLMYERVQESIDLINIKCHDLKFQIREIRSGSQSSVDENLKEIEAAISIYTSCIKTGNDVLDTILTERSLQCEYEKIRLIHIVDGAVLSNISPNQLYSLFGNAISNAIEAVKKIDNIDKRLIHLNVQKHNDMVFIHIDNYCEISELHRTEGGFLQTTKEDKENHGYGLKSMSMLAEKLGGSMEYHIENDIFHLNIFIPA
ncbi:GHKL domain-containing protein [Pseudobutyrivibrio sp. ACV-2]|uniref:ATP-binding protein n=1 Tax=Pseudobutyrivibrio sp. ACV-2 TaxID=1520801 RepID=UPI0008951509|nr:ATP-binding protein [Pseudobutyrivibrio sp. ACV-2]SEA92718.1 GHKL domain-containing protein [Pseudobutyrivibrio sp. ACV-2]